MNFIPEKVPLSKNTGPAYWFAFRNDELLVKMADERTIIPCITDLSSFNLKPVRTQYIGTLDERPCYSAELKKDVQAPEGMSFHGLRQIFVPLGDDLFRIAGRAIQIMKWDQNHQFCGRCGNSTETVHTEHAKVCVKCGLRCYPRLSPATITAVIKGKRILLAHAGRFPSKLYSVIAGFTESGETLEECVKREIMEEVGIEVKNIRYFGSQPWPFPDSLMVAFTAEYAGGKIVIDKNEIADAGWFSADDLPGIPDKVSIARRLIDWFVANY